MSPDVLQALLRTNVLRTQFLTYVESGLHSLQLYETDFTVSGSRGNAKVYTVELAGKANKTTASDPFPSYVCGYKDNGIVRVHLGTQADFCFTVTMNSCTFGIGSQNEGGVLVTHANAKSGGSFPSAEMQQMSAAERQATMSRIVHGPDATLIQPSDYYEDLGLVEDKLHTTTVGIRIAARWRFFLHRYKVRNAAKSCTFLDFAEFQTANG